MPTSCLQAEPGPATRQNDWGLREKSWNGLGKRTKSQAPMKRPLLLIIGLLFIFNQMELIAQDTSSPSSWHAKSLPEALLYMTIFTVVGMTLAIVGYKLFDRFTPGDLSKEIIEHRNIAAALLGAAVILGTCILVAASMVG